MSDRAALLTSPLVQGPGALSRQRQLIQRLKQAILEGHLPAGGKLPSSRTLSEDLGIARNTVLIAYEQLTAEGFVLADRQGTRVATLSSNLVHTVSSPPSVAPPPAPYAQRLASFASAKPSSDRCLPMTPGTPALSQFPMNAWRRAQDRALQDAPSTILGYGEPAGERVLREAIAQYLRVSRGVRCDASRIVITEGAQGALSLCVSLLTNPGDTAWLEEPGYRGAKAAFHGGDLNVVPFRVDSDGIAIAPQAWAEQAPRLIQTTPSHQYPTGAVLSVARRLDLIEQARRIGAWIIEDDYDSEFRLQGEPIGAMQGLVADAPVLYVGTFSKTMFPALRLGFLVLPEALAKPAMSAITEILRGGHRLEQFTMAAFIAHGQFSRHLGRMRRLYRERQQALRDALATHFGVEHEVLGGHCGLHLTVRLPSNFPDLAIVEQARLADMNPSALSTFAMHPSEQDNGLVIGYGNTAAERFAPLIKRLGAIARNLRGARAAPR